MSGSSDRPVAVLMAGAPAANNALYHRVRFLVGDPTAFIELHWPDGRREATFILRDIEMQRARRHAQADQIACPADFAPDGGLSGDRETATAQSAAEFLRRRQVSAVRADRSLPLIYAHFVQQLGIDLTCDVDLGVQQRRAKDEQEIAWLREAQSITERAIRLACELIASARAGAGGVLQHDGAPLTSERVRSAVDIWLLNEGYENPVSIIAGGPTGADCHDHGSGELKTEQPVIVDIFPRSRATRYNGDCTRTVVHGNNIPDQVRQMHQAVVAAKAPAVAATRAGVTGEQVHAATIGAITAAGYRMGLPSQGAAADECRMTHGTGHGVGLEVHEPPLLDRGGPALVAGDCLTIEPGLYCRAIGGVRVEDMVIVTAGGCDNLNALPEGLTWK
jgi:Xaa-Pro aminopeptidase